MDPESSEGVVGFISIQSNKRFKISVNVYVPENSIQTVVAPRQLKIGSEPINIGQTISVPSKKLEGNLSVAFDIDWGNLQTEEFPVTLEFTFYPF
ncbi:hypothetical protein [Fervidobacterium changbaicum]|uniref:Uncharacterized protein n=1 Tax=Fervidobacterium changbaicum TaxID=310769 RepID=A0ABX5QS32_9BACT|nr:hypothetical protein [Fervidobacterium changbaicum]QAV33249.1 hypothetical protein CBS1_05615 [Fervidobacterium changbaicum]